MVDADEAANPLTATASAAASVPGADAGPSAETSGEVMRAALAAEAEEVEDLAKKVCFPVVHPMAVHMMQLHKTCVRTRCTQQVFVKRLSAEHRVLRAAHSAARHAGAVGGADVLV